ncbi:MucB/RseB C-terminal domain-containing protein [Xenophilus arseniciresistens]|uniref:MucB/RseB C-terminal domain-containing protein n=1 Tax=Xenophilus arseniciresistens TaxID=1283306 RepID=A0AAE3NBD9_9BURK|nr:MucB/RseB C-terminal domain-containing protein [Xenophilus arseniciresistens]MDA7416534.1 MucB/RseB C-terminal domain-containing protein [Xenophilus arseniciresistens]
MCVALAAALTTATVTWAQQPRAMDRQEPANLAGPPDTQNFGVMDWLRRMHEAARQSNYVGTFVVSAATGNLSSARIWHACEGELQVERVEALSGPQRITYRRQDRVQTFFPESRLVKSERREILDVFPNLRGVSDAQIEALYSAQRLGHGRVAGIEADVVQLAARDPWRYGYRVWSERRTGLIVKLQTLNNTGQVVEQSAFSELQLDAPLSASSLAQMMDKTAGYTEHQTVLKRTTAEKEGWALREAVPGFLPVSCYRRAMAGAKDRDPQQRMVQWTFSDGLATVSLFIEPAPAAVAREDSLMVLGATHTLVRRLTEPGGEGWWVTAVGEVPAQTLDQFVSRLVRVSR